MSAVTVTPAPLPVGGSAAGAVSMLSDDVKTKLLITEDNFDLAVDVDSEIEDSLGADFWESDHNDTDFDPDYVQPLDRDYVDDPEEFKAYLERARSAWTEKELHHMKSFLKSKGMEAWLKEYVITRREPVEKLLFAFGVLLSKERRNLDDFDLLPLLKAALIRRFLIFSLHRAGISVSCGIPDFRSRNGLYSQLFSSGLYDLDDPQQMFDINYFKNNPAVFYSFAQLTLGSVTKNYTQNIDTLETKAGIKNVLQCHGSFATASCINCRSRVPGDEIKNDLLAQRIPLCKFCNTAQLDVVKPKRTRKKKKKKRNDGWESEEPEEPASPLPPGIMKPDITFFGEKLSNEFDRKIFEDIKSVDLLLIIGTSLKVRPVSEILTHIPHHVPVVVINKTPLVHIKADCQLLGDADVIIEYLADKLGWDISPASSPKQSRKRSRTERREIGTTGVIMFDGAEGGRFVADLLAKKPPFEWDWTTSDEDADSESEEPKQSVKRAKAS
ncbi:hypothetical protein EW145_g1697 [Phellinidium pouzarii]|uniref:Deacetylase sirtuin-type domain-containing protein n=1 Tax=Phellinidium pouzarii TaxID=167371 RepID=A0A4S4LFG0_9AGAM|nr:hypothetical protein EW145_g1697 [Phellinidium pouzarii]